MTVIDGRKYVSRAEMLDQSALRHSNELATMQDYLAHHGVMGMKWGVRRYQPYYPRDGQQGKGKYSGEMARKAKAATSKKKSELTKGQKRIMEAKVNLKAAKKGKARMKVADSLSRSKLRKATTADEKHRAANIMSKTAKASYDQARKIQDAKRAVEVAKAADNVKKTAKLQKKYGKQDASRKLKEQYLKDRFSSGDKEFKAKLDAKKTKQETKIAKKMTKAVAKGQVAKQIKLETKAARQKANRDIEKVNRDVKKLDAYSGARSGKTYLGKQNRMAIQKEQSRQATIASKSVKQHQKSSAAYVKAASEQSAKIKAAKSLQKTKTQQSKLSSQSKSLTTQLKQAQSSGNKKQAEKLKQKLYETNLELKQVETVLKQKKKKP